MTDLHLPRLDLARAVTDALARGRYVLMTDGAGRPLEITLDLKERPDDLFSGEVIDSFDWVGNSSPGRLNAAHPSDDHGPSVPAQGELHRSAEIVGEDNGWAVREPGPIVYEFALQDFNAPLAAAYTLDEMTERRVQAFGSLDIKQSFREADWVHVYDRVTRERRTLKRPEPDAVLTGLRDVAADLRDRPVAQMARGHGKSEAVRDIVRGAPVEPPFGCAALPPVGPLTSTEGLRAGDVLRVIKRPDPDEDFGASNGDIVTIKRIARFPGFSEIVFEKGGPSWSAFRFAFVGRPDADGWMTWAGGENPVPGVTVEAVFGHGGHWTVNSEALSWTETSDCRIVQFRIVDTLPSV